MVALLDFWLSQKSFIGIIPLYDLGLLNSAMLLALTDILLLNKVLWRLNHGIV
jgi:hypothetical protein